MNVEGIDERNVGGERNKGNFLVFIYEGVDSEDNSWSVDSFLLTEADLGTVLAWLRERLPPNACWSLGAVTHPTEPTSTSEVSVDWIVGADILNVEPHRMSAEEHRVAREMLARRHRVELP